MTDTPNGPNAQDDETSAADAGVQPGGTAPATPEAGEPLTMAPDMQAPGAEATPQLRVISQFIRDLSFENPNAPNTLSSEAQQGQEVNINVDVQGRRMPQPPNAYECMLKIHAAVKREKTPHFIVELAYSGIFLLENIPDGAEHAVMLIEAPRILFPFARRIVADTTRDGGFMPLLLDPIDFAALYRQQMAQAAQQQMGAQAAPQEMGPAQT